MTFSVQCHLINSLLFSNGSISEEIKQEIERESHEQEQIQWSLTTKYYIAQLTFHLFDLLSSTSHSVNDLTEKQFEGIILIPSNDKV
jgi:DUF4097 and DUF4098 domain-containing protein YvlB